MARGDFPSSKQDQFVLRFPDGMRDKIKHAAAENGRSMNAEVVDRLERSFRPDARSLSDLLAAEFKASDKETVPLDEGSFLDRLTSRIERTTQKVMEKTALEMAESLRRNDHALLTVLEEIYEKDGKLSPGFMKTARDVLGGEDK